MALSLSPLGFFLLRRPLLPLEKLLSQHQITDQLQAQALIRLFSDPLLSEAILMASPGLFISFQKLKQSGSLGKNHHKVLETLYRYLVRICTRATPYGLFSGVATGSLTEKTLFDFSEGEPFRRVTRLDAGYNDGLIRQLEAVPGVRMQLSYRLNSSLESRQGDYRYIERRETAAGTVHILTAIEPGPVLETALDLVREGITAAALVKALACQMPFVRARALVSELIDAQVIESELQQTVTGRDCFETVCEKVRGLKGARQQKQLLDQLDRLLREPEVCWKQYRQLQMSAATKATRPENSPVLKTDVVYNGSWTLKAKWVNVLAREFEKVSPLLEMSRHQELAQFRQAFLDRYEGRQVPLAQALDSADGLGYGMARPGYCEEQPLLEDLTFPGDDSTTLSFNEDPTDRLKQALVERALLENSYAALLTDKDLEQLAAGPPPDGDGVYWLGSFLAASAADLDRGDFQFLARAMGGASGLELLGRFCQADPVLAGYVSQAARQYRERNADVIYAEIAHSPAGRLGNILQRPHLSEYEIVYLCASQLPVQSHIYLSDLMVSVTGSQVMLTSKRLGKRIVPRLTTAHNYSGGLPVYRFLCDVGGQGTVFGWQWSHLSCRTFLPRVQYGHWILARARWRIDKDRFPFLFDPRTDFESEWETVRGKLRIPRYVQITEGDRELLIDSASSLSLQLLRRQLVKDGTVILVEFPSNQTGLLKGYTNEVVLPFRYDRKQPNGYMKDSLPPRVKKEERREFPPGSDWTYVKVYCGPQTADRLIRERIGPLLKALTGSKKIEKWFFIRFADPEPHLRIRYYVKGGNTGACPLEDTLSDVLKAGWAYKIQYDTYSRELERYAGPAYEKTESIFHADSETVVKLVGLTGSPDERWLAGLAGADRLMKAMAMDLAARSALAAASFEHLFTEFGGDTALEVQLDRKYRRDRPRIEAWLSQPPAALERALNRRSAVIVKCLKRCREPVQMPVAASFVHMFFNRLLLSHSRRQEMVLYYFLKKFYLSLLKKSNRPG